MNDSIGTLDHNALAIRMKINQIVLPEALGEMLNKSMAEQKQNITKEHVVALGQSLFPNKWWSQSYISS